MECLCFCRGGLCISRFESYPVKLVIRALMKSHVRISCFGVFGAKLRPGYRMSVTGIDEGVSRN